MVLEAAPLLQLEEVSRLQDTKPDAENPQLDLSQRVSIGHIRHQALLLHRVIVKDSLCTVLSPQRHAYAFEGRPAQAVYDQVGAQRACIRFHTRARVQFSVEAWRIALCERWRLCSTHLERADLAITK